MLKNALGLFVAAIVALMVFLPSYTQMQDLRAKNDAFQKQIDDLTSQNKSLRQERLLLERDPVYLEKVARERMGLVREGEVVYKLVPVNATVNAQKPEAPAAVVGKDLKTKP